MDFALWKAVAGRALLKSPWSDGRPLAYRSRARLMARRYLGKTIDIHGGAGSIFPTTKTR